MKRPPSTPEVSGDEPEGQSLRSEHLNLIDHRIRLTESERKNVLDRAATHPGTEAALAKGDALFHRFLKRPSERDVPSPGADR